MQELLKEYFSILSHWNKRIKLVSRADDFDSFVFEHVEDVLRMRRHVEGASSLIDLGTGAGIPGMLIKMDMPELRVVLLDSVRKKISFCDEAIRKLGLEGIETMTGRAEDDAIIEALGRFDVIVSRATWKLDGYLKMAMPYMKDRRSRVISMKGPGWREEFVEAEPILREKSMRLVASDEYEHADGKQRCILVMGR